MNAQTTHDTHGHSYRATLIPQGMAAEDVEAAAGARALPERRLRAANADKAAHLAHVLSGGLPVLRIERVEQAERPAVNDATFTPAMA